MKAIILALILATALFVLWLDDEHKKIKDQQDFDRWKQKFDKK